MAGPLAEKPSDLIYPRRRHTDTLDGGDGGCVHHRTTWTRDYDRRCADDGGACRCARVCEKEIGERDTPVTPAIGERAAEENGDTSKGHRVKRRVGKKKRERRDPGGGAAAVDREALKEGQSDFD